MGWPRLRLEPAKMGASKIVVMIDAMIGGMIAEGAGGMISVVIITAATTVETTEEMIGASQTGIVEALPRVSRPRLPLRAKEQGAMTGMTTRLKMPPT